MGDPQLKRKLWRTLANQGGEFVGNARRETAAGDRGGNPTDATRQ